MNRSRSTDCVELKEMVADAFGPSAFKARHSYYK